MFFYLFSSHTFPVFLLIDHTFHVFQSLKQKSQRSLLDRRAGHAVTHRLKT